MPAMTNDGARRSRRLHRPRRPDGLYWIEIIGIVRDLPMIIKSRRGVWIFDDGEKRRTDKGLRVLGGPLTPPTPEAAAGWRGRYDRFLAHLKAAGDDEALTTPDYLEGYYWIGVAGDPEVVLGWFFDGSWLKVGTDDENAYDHAEIYDGPLIPPMLSPPGRA